MQTPAYVDTRPTNMRESCQSWVSNSRHIPLIMLRDKCCAAQLCWSHNTVWSWYICQYRPFQREWHHTASSLIWHCPRRDIKTQWTLKPRPWFSISSSERTCSGNRSSYYNYSLHLWEQCVPNGMLFMCVIHCVFYMYPFGTWCDILSWTV